MKRVKTFKRTLSLLLCLIMVFGSAPLAGLVGIDLPNITNLFTPKAEAATKYTNGYYTYEVSDGKAEITDVDASIRGGITIPSTLGGYPVTAIWSFENCKGLESVTLPDGVTSIGNSAFSGCTSLSSITIPDDVTSIGADAFVNTAYYNNESNWENGVLYIGNHLIKAENTISGSYVIKDGTKTIAGSAFYNCKSLTSITIPDSVTSIDYGVFRDCTSLSSITIPDGVTSIGDYAFENTAYYNNESNWENGLLYIGNHLIKAENTISGSYVIKDGTKTIADSVFYNCKSLTSITIPDSVTSIGDYAFKNTAYYNNESNWKNGLLYIGNHLIAAKDTISGSYVIKDGTKTIADGAFSGCESLESVTIPDSVTSIGKYAFWFCMSLENVHYTGTEVEWSAIMIGDHNECLIEAQKVIRRPSRTSISYGDSIVLHVKDSRIPAGGYVVWTADNDNFSYSVSSDGTTCTISPKSSGSTVFTATVYDKDGKAVSSSSREMESKAGIWQKILGFFKALFGLIKIYPYAIENIF